MTRATIGILLMALLGSAAAGCASVGSTVEVTSEASGSAYFSLGPPVAYKSQTGLQFTGRVCRRARNILLSPPRVRLEHVTPQGSVAEVAAAHVPAIYRRADQACSYYSAHVAWQMGEGDTVRACFDRGRACPFNAPGKAVVAVPVPSGPTSNR